MIVITVSNITEVWIFRNCSSFEISLFQFACIKINDITKTVKVQYNIFCNIIWVYERLIFIVSKLHQNIYHFNITKHVHLRTDDK